MAKKNKLFVYLFVFIAMLSSVAAVMCNDAETNRKIANGELSLSYAVEFTKMCQKEPDPVQKRAAKVFDGDAQNTIWICKPINKQPNKKLCWYFGNKNKWKIESIYKP